MSSPLPSPNPRACQVCLDGRVEALGFSLLLSPLGGEAGHFLLEGFAVVGLGLGADIAARSEYVAVLANLLKGRALAEAGDVGVALTLTLSQWERESTDWLRQEW